MASGTVIFTSERQEVAERANSSSDAEVPLFGEAILSFYQDRWRIGWTFGSVLGLFLLAAMLVPASYWANATLAVLPAPEFTVRPDAGSSAIVSQSLALDQIMKAETEILSSSDLARETIAVIGLATIYPDLGAAASVPESGLATLRRRLFSGSDRGTSDLDRAMTRAVDRFASHTEILASKDANVITVSFRHPDPAIAARAVNILLGLYATHRGVLYGDAQSPAVGEQAAALRGAADDAASALVAFERSHGIANYTLQRDQLLQRLSTNEAALADSAAATAEQRARADTNDGQLLKSHRLVEFYQERDTDQRSASLTTQLHDLQNHLIAAQGRYQPGSRLITGLQAQIASVRQLMQHDGNDPTPSVQRTGRNPVADILQSDAAHAEADFAAARARHTALTVEHARLTRALAALGKDEMSLDKLTRRKTLLDSELQISAQILNTRQLTEAEDTLRLAKVRVIQPAREPTKPRPIAFILLVAGVMAATISALAVALAGLALRRTFLTPQALAQTMGMPVLASIWEPCQMQFERT